MDMKISFSGGKKVDAEYKGFHIKTDQPIQQGGEESAPEPFSLFLASIGTCSGFYVLSFCEKRNISTENISLLLTFEKDCETHLIKKISIQVCVPKDFPNQYKNALIKAVNLCAVKKHLDTPPDISIEVKQ